MTYVLYFYVLLVDLYVFPVRVLCKVNVNFGETFHFDQYLIFEYRNPVCAIHRTAHNEGEEKKSTRLWHIRF